MLVTAPSSRQFTLHTAIEVAFNSTTCDLTTGRVLCLSMPAIVAARTPQLITLSGGISEPRNYIVSIHISYMPRYN